MKTLACLLNAFTKWAIVLAALGLVAVVQGAEIRPKTARKGPGDLVATWELPSSSFALNFVANNTKVDFAPSLTLFQLDGIAFFVVVDSMEESEHGLKDFRQESEQEAKKLFEEFLDFKSEADLSSIDIVEIEGRQWAQWEERSEASWSLTKRTLYARTLVGRRPVLLHVLLRDNDDADHARVLLRRVQASLVEMASI